MVVSSRSKPDYIQISQAEAIRFSEYKDLPLERIDLFRQLVQLRMVYFEGGFRSHLDLINRALAGKYFEDVSFAERRNMLSIWNFPGLNGILAISPLVRKGYDCLLINNLDAEFDILADALAGMEQPIVGISTTFSLQWSEIGRMVSRVRTLAHRSRIILGGAFVHNAYLAHGTAFFHKPMRKYGIDFVLFGKNAERELDELFETLRGHGPALSAIPNLLYRTDGEIYQTERMANDSLLSNPPGWEDLVEKRPWPLVQLRTSSGCCFQCAFCSYPVLGHGLETSSLETVRAQLDGLARSGRVRTLVFVDDNLNVPLPRFRRLLEMLKDFSFEWYGFLRVQYIDEELATVMRDAGCRGVYLGVESGSRRILENMKKKAVPEEYRAGIQALKRLGIITMAAVILGFPGETEETIQETIEFLESSGLDYYSIKEFFYLHTAPIHQNRELFGLEGEGVEWRHATMTSLEASQAKLRVFERVKNVVHVDPDLGLWYLVCLKERGLGWSQIRMTQQVLNEMVGRDNQKRFGDKSDLFLKMQAILTDRTYPLA